MINNNDYFQSLTDQQLAQRIQQREYHAMINNLSIYRDIIRTRINNREPITTQSIRVNSYEFLSSLSDLMGNVSRGATDTDIDKLPVSKYNSETRHNNDEKCTICTSEFNSNTDIITLPCNHFFCKECTIRWLKINKQCPICRCDITEV